MRRRLLRLLERAARAALLFVTATATAAVPGLLNYQGRLTDTSNVPRNGTYSMTFSVWDSGPATGSGTQLWSETQSNVTVSNGLFSVQLGSVTPLPASVSSGTSAYLQVQIGSEVASARQRLVSSPYAFRSATADDVAPGDTDYVQVANTLQAGAAFNVSSATVSGPLRVAGVITAGSGANAITTAAGLVDATKLSGTVPSANLSGVYANLTAGDVAAGSANYVQNRDTLQSGATFYVSKGTVSGPFTASGAVTLGAAGGSANVTVAGNLSVTGAGPHVFTGDVQVNGNHLLDSAGTARLTLGSNIIINGAVAVPATSTYLPVNVPIQLTGTPNGDNYIAYPMVAGGAITAKDVVVINGANTVTTTSASADTNVVGFAVNNAQAGDTVWVAMSGIITGLTTNGAVTLANPICSANAAGKVDDSCNSNFAVIGKALTGATGSGQTITAVIYQGR